MTDESSAGEAKHGGVNPSGFSDPDLGTADTFHRPPGGSDATAGSNESSPVELPGYELIEVIGRGGMGEVWRALQRSLEREVAIKLLPSSLARDPEFVARFEKEATALAALSHPNVIHIIDRGRADTQYYFVMEYVRGTSLRALVERERPSWGQGLHWVWQICQAMDYAHGLGVIHRDLKPENILVDARGHVKVADFGLAGFVGPAKRLSLTLTSATMGTLNYMAPEQRKDASRVDGRADLYALGVILYELLTGELPIGRFRLPSQQVPELDPRLDDVVCRLLEPDPADRYADAQELLQSLSPLMPSNTGASPGGAIETTRAASSAPRNQQARAMAEQTTTSVQYARTMVRRGWSGVRYGLTIVGAVVLVAWLGRMASRADDAPFELPWAASTSTTATVAAPKPFPENTATNFVVGAEVKRTDDGRIEIFSTFEPPEDPARKPWAMQGISAHDGTWWSEDGKLRALQAGNESYREGVVPRAYLVSRYFSSDEFYAEVDVSFEEIASEYGVDPDAARYVELDFRIKGFQVGVFVIPGDGTLLMWKYLDPSGEEILGNSSGDQESFLEDELRPKRPGEPFRLRLSTRKVRDGTLVEAFMGKRRFARKILPGLSDATAKLALGCRNLSCTFDNLRVKALESEQPKRPKKSQETQETQEAVAAETPNR